MSVQSISEISRCKQEDAIRICATHNYTSFIILLLIYCKSGMGTRIWSIYGSRSLARPYILQYCALTHCNDCNIRVAHVAIYCSLGAQCTIYIAIFASDTPYILQCLLQGAIYWNIAYIAIYCQYIVYCIYGSPSLKHNDIVNV